VARVTRGVAGEDRFLSPALPIAVTLAALSLAWIQADFRLVRSSLWVIYGLLALSLDLIWGRVGIFSFGQTAFFGVAGYGYGAIAINLMARTGESTTALLGAVVVAALFAALLGYFMFYGRVSDVYLAIITLAVTLVLLTFFASTAGPDYAIGEARLGGYNGMVGVPPVTLGVPGLLARPLSIRETYMFLVLLAGAVYFGLTLLLRAPFGRILRAVRDNELRTELLGYDARWYKLLAFVLGGAIAGLAGANYAAWGYFINPAVFSLQQAALVVIWVLVGGRGTLIGAFLGVVTVEWLASELGSRTAQTPLFLGLLLILVVLVLPGGIASLAPWGWRRLVVAGRMAAGDGVLIASSARPSTPAADDSRLPTSPDGGVGSPAGADLATDRVSIAFGGLKAVDDVTLRFDAGLHCLIGPNGAGKSTLFNLLVGRYRPSTGRVTLRGQDITRLEPFQRAERGIGIKLQVPSLYPQLSVDENVWLAAYARDRDARRAGERVAAVLERVGLSGRAAEPAGSLSHGEQQWLEIGMVLAGRPAVFLLDEPTAGMTREETARTAELVAGLAREATVVVVEHDMEFVRRLGAPVTLLHQGRVFRRGSLDNLREDADVLNIYLGRRAAGGRSGGDGEPAAAGDR
jgi:branched-chain amino acid transport system permease protein